MSLCVTNKIKICTCQVRAKGILRADIQPTWVPTPPSLKTYCRQYTNALAQKRRVFYGTIYWVHIAWAHNPASEFAESSSCRARTKPLETRSGPRTRRDFPSRSLRRARHQYLCADVQIGAKAPRSSSRNPHHRPPPCKPGCVAPWGSLEETAHLKERMIKDRPP